MKEFTEVRLLQGNEDPILRLMGGGTAELRCEGCNHVLAVGKAELLEASLSNLSLVCGFCRAERYFQPLQPDAIGSKTVVLPPGDYRIEGSLQLLSGYNMHGLKPGEE